MTPETPGLDTIITRIDGEPILGLRDRSGTQRAMVKLDKADGAPLMFVTDTDGNMLWHAP